MRVVLGCVSINPEAEDFVRQCCHSDTLTLLILVRFVLLQFASRAKKLDRVFQIAIVF